VLYIDTGVAVMSNPQEVSWVVWDFHENRNGYDHYVGIRVGRNGNVIVGETSILWRETATSCHTKPLLFVLAFYNKWMYRNDDCCVKIDDDSSAYDKNIVSFWSSNL